MILDKLVEKKDLLIYADQRIIRLRLNGKEMSQKLRDPNVSNNEKKILMRGRKQIAGRIKELKTLRYVLSSGLLRKKAKEYWDTNYREIHGLEETAK